MTSFNFQPIDSKIDESKQVLFESNEELLKDIEASLRNELLEDIQSGKHKVNYYLNNKALAAELVKSKIEGQLTNKCIDMFKKLIFHVQRRLYYKDPDVKQDCASEAMAIIAAKWRSYDVQKSPNAFSYFTTTILNGLAKGWNDGSKPGIHIPIDMLYQTTKKQD